MSKLRGALLMGLAWSLCACLGEPDDAGDVEDEDVEAEEIDVASLPMPDMGQWVCAQTCSNGSVRHGFGSTVEEAWQALNACGKGGSEIYCGTLFSN